MLCCLLLRAFLRICIGVDRINRGKIRAAVKCTGARCSCDPRLVQVIRARRSQAICLNGFNIDPFNKKVILLHTPYPLQYIPNGSFEEQLNKVAIYWLKYDGA